MYDIKDGKNIHIYNTKESGSKELKENYFPY